MEIALYDPELGYYARSAQRSGRAGDFFTSVDVGPLFGELLALQIAEMHRLLQTSNFDVVEAGAGNGRLSADILRALRDGHPELYSRLRLHLIETSAAARDAQRSTLGDLHDRLASSGPSLPESFEGVLVANELLDALPVHQVVMREDGLREVYVAAASGRHENTKTRSDQDGFVRSRFRGDLELVEGPPSTPALQGYIDRLGVTLEPGWRGEITHRAASWIRYAARRLRRGFIVLIDYGHEARELYSASHEQGTLTTFSDHRSDPAPGGPRWLDRPGEQDITAHVDFTSVRDAAEAAGLTSVAFLDQTYFVLGLVRDWSATMLAQRARPLKTLMM